MECYSSKTSNELGEPCSVLGNRVCRHCSVQQPSPSVGRPTHSFRGSGNTHIRSQVLECRLTRALVWLQDIHTVVTYVKISMQLYLVWSRRACTCPSLCGRPWQWGSDSEYLSLLEIVRPVQCCSRFSARICVTGCMWQAHCKHHCTARAMVDKRDATRLHANDMIHAGRTFVACRAPNPRTCPRNHKCKPCDVQHQYTHTTNHPTVTHEDAQTVR